MERILKALLSVLFGAAEFLGWFFIYALVVYLATDGKMVGRFGFYLIIIASVVTASGLLYAILKLGRENG